MSYNLAAAKHSIIGSIIELNKIAGSIEYSGPFYGCLKLLESTDRIWFTGIGKSGLVAQRGASMMRTIGWEASFIDPVAAMHGESGAIKPDNAIVALSHSGETEEVLDFLNHVRCYRVVALCKPRSTLAERATWTLPVEADEWLPTVSCAAQSAWIDALVVALAHDVEHVLQATHPSGAIGRRLRNGTASEGHNIEEGDRAADRE